MSAALAGAADLDGILAVQEQNLPENGGSLSARFSRDWFGEAIATEALVVGRVGGSIAGYVAFTPPEAQLHVPIVQAMLAASPAPGAYLHGPICVGVDFRGRGVADAMFVEQRRLMSHAPVIAFIRDDNAASRRAHQRMGLREVAEFAHGDSRYVVVAG